MPDDKAEEIKVDLGALTGASPGDSETPEGFGRSGTFGRLSLTTIMVLVNTVILAALMAYVMTRPSPPAERPSESAPAHVSPASVELRDDGTLDDQAVVGIADKERKQLESFQIAQENFRAGDYAVALEHYRLALDAFQRTPSGRWVADLVRYRMGTCIERLGDVDRAFGIKSQLVNSASWLVALYSRHCLIRIAYERGDFVEARRLAGEALSVAQALPGSENIQRDCRYVLAATMTQRALRGSGRAIMEACEVMTAPESREALADWDGAELVSYLMRGKIDLAARMAGAPLSVSIAAPGLVDLVANGTTLEEVLSRVALLTHRQINWEGAGDVISETPVTAFFEAAPVESVVDLLCAGAGLVTRATDAGIRVINPAALGTPAETLALLTEEALEAWRQFFLRYQQDEAVPRGYFATAALEACQGNLSAAVTEFRMLARHFADSEVSALGLLSAARLMMDVADYAGAVALLDEMIERYPRAEELDDAYLVLGRAYIKSGFKEKGIEILRKTAYLEFDQEVTREAVLELGRSCHEMGRFKEAEGWLMQYFSAYAGTPEIAEVALLLGKCNVELGSAEAAIRSLAQAWQEDRAGALGVEALITMAQVELSRGNCLMALNAVETVTPSLRGSNDARRVALLKAKVFRGMCLSELAVEILTHELAGNVTEAEATEMYILLAGAYDDVGRPDKALAALTDALLKVRDPERMNRLQLEAARVYANEGKYVEAAGFARRVARDCAGTATYDDAMKILAKAYEAAGDPLRAALCLAGLWEEDLKEQ